MESIAFQFHSTKLTMVSPYEPLLNTPNKKPTNVKLLLSAFVSLAAILGSIAIFYPTILTQITLTTSDPSKFHYLCNTAYSRSACLTVLSEVEHVGSSDPNLALRTILAKSSSRMKETLDFISHVRTRINDVTGQTALADCLELLDSSMDRVTDSMVALETSHSEAHMWLSAVLTNHATCLDGLTGPAKLAMEPMMNALVSRAHASLAMAAAIAPTPVKDSKRGLPPWISGEDRRLMRVSGPSVNANAVVAKDGTGNYSTIQAAVDAAPKKSTSRYTIYVKKGTYKEQVNVAKNKKNIMLIGDGMEATIITGSLNVVDGATTFNSATLIARGDGFIGQDLWIQNTAGPEKHQAVALRVGSDKSVINRCKIDAYQDTLYAHSLRQFYRDCYITGTVDFIFGDAAAVIQNSQIVARKPMTGQNNMVTAQGRKDPNSPTGTSIQNCNIVPSSDLAPVKESFKTFLGRPWKQFSRAVYMQSNIDDHIDPTGWSPWSGDFALKTLYYGEYMNRGAGAGTGRRVTWPGYHVITSAAEASKFTVAQLIQGGEWLSNTGVTYTEGL